MVRYAHLQRRCKRDQTETARAVLSGDWCNDASEASSEDLARYWSAIFGKGSKSDDRRVRDAKHLVRCIEPIELEEILEGLAGASGVGPGGRQWSQIRKKGRVQSEEMATLLASMLNCWLWAGDIPSRMLEGTTKLIPCRMNDAIILDPWQKGFRAGDGIFLNAMVLQQILHNARVELSSVPVLFLDVSGAFDNVSQISAARLSQTGDTTTSVELLNATV